jgi:hypothetical protein
MSPEGWLATKSDGSRSMGGVRSHTRRAENAHNLQSNTATRMHAIGSKFEKGTVQRSDFGEVQRIFS